jgi:hypothetical protein
MKIVLATGSDSNYQFKIIPYLLSIKKYSNFDCNILVYYDNGICYTSDICGNEITLSNIDPSCICCINIIKCLQHGEFLKSPAFNFLNKNDVIVYTDGDIVLQRCLENEEIQFLHSLKNGQIFVGFNAHPKDTLYDEAKRLGQVGSVPMPFCQFDWSKYKIYNTGVLAMNKHTWEELAKNYTSLYHFVDNLFNHYAKQQWLISFIVGTNKYFSVIEMPYSFHTHNHFETPAGLEQRPSGLACYNNKTVLFKHKFPKKLTFVCCFRDPKRYSKSIASISNSNCGFEFDLNGFDNSKNKTDCYSVLRQALLNSSSDFMVWMHDDVCLNQNDVKSLLSEIEAVISKFPSAAVFGIAGKDNLFFRGQGHFYSSSGEEKWGFDERRPISSLDECFLVIKNGLGIELDSTLKGFHFYGTELCLQARQLGYSCHVIDFPISHSSDGSLDKSFFEAKKIYEQHVLKRYGPLFISTTCTVLYSGKSHFMKALRDALSLKMLSNKYSKHKDHETALEWIRLNGKSEYGIIFWFIAKIIANVIFSAEVVKIQNLFWKYGYQVVRPIIRGYTDILWWKKNWKTRL